MDAPDTALQGQDMSVVGRLYTAFELGEKNRKLSLGDGVCGPSRCTVTAGERRKREKAFGELVVSSGHATKMFDAIEEAFDQIAHAIQRTVVVSFRLVVRARGNNGLRARGPNLIHNHKGVGIVALVRDDSPRAQMVDQFCGTRDIGNLPFSDHHAQRTTCFIRGQTRFGAQPSAGATKRLRSIFWGARRVLVRSHDGRIGQMYSISASPDAACTMHCQTLCVAIGRSACTPAYSAGRSRHGQPVRLIHSTVSTNQRLLEAARPPGSPSYPGRLDSILFHTSSPSSVRIIPSVRA